jgi:DNA-binding NarL/FixJ family response regulator
MPANRLRGDHLYMKPNTANTPPGPEVANGRLHVAIWSPFGPLKRQLRELVERSHGADVVELSAHPLPQAVRDCGASVFVVDVDGSAEGAAELIKAVLRAAPDVRVLAVSTHADQRMADCAVRSGAAGYVLKDHAYEELANAVCAVAQNQSYVSPSIDRTMSCRP